MAAGALWWALALATRHAGVALPWAVPPPLAHALFMAMGFMPLFVVGFLFTAGPRWLGLSDVPARSLRDPVLTMLSGWVVALAGFHLHEALAGAGVALVAGGWSAVVLRFVRLLRSSPVADQLHARVIAVAAAIGALALSGAAGRWPRARSLACAWPRRWRVGMPGADLRHGLAPHDSVLHRQRAALPGCLAAELATVGDAGRAGVCGAGGVADLLWWPLPAAGRWTQVAVEARRRR